MSECTTITSKFTFTSYGNTFASYDITFTSYGNILTSYGSTFIDPQLFFSL